MKSKSTATNMDGNGVETTELMTSRVDMGGQPIAPQHFASEQYLNPTKNPLLEGAKLLKMNGAKIECRELGFAPKTPDFGNCVLQLIK